MGYRREDIERVRAASNLVDLIADVTKVRKSGRSVMAICPFHQEKTPSMSVDAARGLYHCFGCGKSGDIFRFLEDSQGLSFNEAVEFLARKGGIPLERDPDADRRRDRREALIAAVDAAVDFYHNHLKSGEDAGPARSYLRGRGYDAEVVESFKLGYAPNSWDVLVGHLRRTGIPEGVVIQAGLASRGRQGRLLDRFRARVMFPVFDLRGDPVGFGARLLEGEGPKYLNSPDGPLYHKSQLLYGLNWAKSDIVRAGHSVVVEGYTDVIALHQAGLPLAVATCGTALGESHLDLLRRFSERVVLAFDADAAGAGASLRGFQHSVPGELDLRVAALPDGMDPADVVTAGELDRLRKAIEESQPLLLFGIEQELARFDLTEPEARVRGARAAAALVARHPDSLVRREYAVALSRRTGLELDDVAALVEGTGRRPSPGTTEIDQGTLTGLEKAERELLRALLANHPGVAALDLDASLFTRPDHARAFEVLAPAVGALAPGRPPDLGSLLGDNDSPETGMLRSLALDQRPIPDPAEVARRLQVGALERRIEEVKTAVEAVDPEADPDEYSARFAELIALERERRQIGGQD